MKRILLSVVVLLLPLSLAFSQGFEGENPAPPQGPGGPMGRGNQQIRRQLEQIKIWQLTKEMNLPTEKAEKFFPLYNRYNSEMKGITDERKKLIRSLDSTVDKQAGESEISGQIKRIMSLDDRLAATHVNFIKSLEEILSPTEVARYIVFEQRFDREIRERIRMMMYQRMDGRGHP
jgi:hypothetical protein